MYSRIGGSLKISGPPDGADCFSRSALPRQQSATQPTGCILFSRFVVDTQERRGKTLKPFMERARRDPLRLRSWLPTKGSQAFIAIRFIRCADGLSPSRYLATALVDTP